MYNGIGLTTPRGSGTSGHVIKNLSYVRPEFFRNKVDSNSGRNNSNFVSTRDASTNSSTGSREILDHSKKRATEAEIFELQEQMLEQGYTDEEIEIRVAEKRKQLEDGDNMGMNKKSNKRREHNHETSSHELTERKSIEMKRVRDAFGIPSSKSSRKDSNEEEETHNGDRRRRDEKR